MKKSNVGLKTNDLRKDLPSSMIILLFLWFYIWGLPYSENL